MTASPSALFAEAKRRTESRPRGATHDRFNSDGDPSEWSDAVLIAQIAALPAASPSALRETSPEFWIALAAWNNVPVETMRRVASEHQTSAETLAAWSRVIAALSSSPPVAQQESKSNGG